MAVVPVHNFAGDLGKVVYGQVCAVCWKEWLGAQVNMINEYKLSMIDPDHRAALTKQMIQFLSLPGATDDTPVVVPDDSDGTPD